MFLIPPFIIQFIHTIYVTAPILAFLFSDPSCHLWELCLFQNQFVTRKTFSMLFPFAPSREKPSLFIPKLIFGHTTPKFAHLMLPLLPFRFGMICRFLPPLLPSRNETIHQKNHASPSISTAHFIPNRLARQVLSTKKLAPNLFVTKPTMHSLSARNFPTSNTLLTKNVKISLSAHSWL